LQYEPLKVEKVEPLAHQLREFLSVVETRGRPRVTGADARRALEVALRIIGEMERHSRVVEATLAAHQG
jgi:predicted dehydrogenase